MKFFIAVCQSVWLWCKPTGIYKELPNMEWFLLLVLGGCDGQLDEEAGMVGDGSAESSHHRITQALHRRCCHCLVCSISSMCHHVSCCFDSRNSDKQRLKTKCHGNPNPNSIIFACRTRRCTCC